jgi:hypothetical protein
LFPYYFPLLFDKIISFLFIEGLFIYRLGINVSNLLGMYPR